MFDIIGVTQRADQALVKNLSNPEESRQIYLEEIMDWTDNYTENNLSLSSSVEAKDALSNIVKLWIAYCTMEISLRQFKQAVKIFEDAISDPVASRSALIYLAYVDYCKTRGKLANAQKVYIKGLSSSLAQDEADKLWESFLPFIRAQGSPSLSMSQLYEAVRNEAGIDYLTPPRIETTEQVAGTCTSETSTDSVLETPIDSIKNSNNSNTSQNLVDIDASSLMTIEESYVDAECKIEEVNNGSSSFIDSSSQDPVDRTEMVIVKDEKIDSINGVEDKILEKEMDLHLIKREGSTTVDISNDTDNSSSSAAAVTDTFVNPGGVGDDLDSVIGMTPEQLTRMYRLRPPMLFSAPNKEPTVFGTSSLSPTDIEELEAFLGVTLTSIRYGERQDKADAYLDLVEGLWTAQALKERHFDSWFTDLKKIHEKEGRELSRACEDKEKEAGPTQPLESLKEKSQTDRKRFRSRCAVQREVLHSVVNKTVYSLLMDQQRALVAAGFPRFTSTVMERIQMAMLAVRNGDATGGTPAAGGQPASNFDPTLLKDIAEQKRILCALLSFRVNLAPNPNQRAGGSGRRDGSDVGQGAFPLMRGSSVGSDFHSGGQNSKSDYYSQDAKQQRKAKRRKFYPAEGGDEIRFDDRRMRVDNGGYDGRRPGQGGQQGQGQGQGNSYQGPDHLRRGPIRRGTVAGAAGRGPAQRNGNNSNSGTGGGTGGGVGIETSSQQNQKIPPSVSNVSQAPTSLLKTDEEVPLTLLQKLATMIQKVKK